MNQRVVVTNGCFDFFHYGHLTLLKEARELGDSLTVLIDTDERMDDIKPGRRITCLQERIDMLMALRCVDVVGFIRDDQNLLKQIRDMEPAYYVKGGEYDLGSLRPYGIVRTLNEIGTEIKFLPMIETDTRMAIGLIKTFKELFTG